MECARELSVTGNIVVVMVAGTCCYIAIKFAGAVIKSFFED